ncbi:hypothetical protein [Rubellicoccus peritrichatus]|uniref:Uncharacterized protein n=1 Tax=Rubellicoccus peritrichatus TaxID=3080537 RepID=A0AAQ3L791_9BACT|nr:hypothetical protein [Puniceicoccus sp. CR14]WOO40610.1 hypothetical protein RZN69_18465 [Puniceicoccus sp. CR14]
MTLTGSSHQSLIELGQKDAALALFIDLKAFAEQKLNEEARVD